MGYTPSKNNAEFWEDGTIPWFRMDDIRENGHVLNNSLQHITNLAVKKGKLFDANSIIESTSATIGEHALIKVPFIANQRFLVFTIKDSWKQVIDMNYMNHYFFSVDEWCKNHVNSGSSFPSVDIEAFKKLEIELPDLETQRIIANLLESYDDLIDVVSNKPGNLIKQKQSIMQTIFA